MDKRPNIIIFNPDQMRADSMAHLGNPASKTPFLDERAETDAVSFRHAFCQNPVCVPSRCSFSTGLYPHVNGHRTMTHMLREHETSLFEELKNAGYYVWMNARNDLVAGEVPGLVERHASEIYYGGGASAGAKGGDVSRGKPGDKQFYSHYAGRLARDENGRYYGPDDEDLDAAIARIKNKPEGQPLCLFLGLMNPHPPYQVEEPFYSSADRGKLPPRVRPEECTGRPDIEAAIRARVGMEAYTEEDWTALRACYLGMCSKVDDMFRQLCEALKEAGEYDNSAIFFLSDHGDFTGDYGLPEKAQNSFPDCLTNVPLLIKPPKGFGVDAGISDSLVELVDFYATAMDFAGVAPTHTHYGRSLKSVLHDRTLPVRDFVTCEGGRNPGEIHCDEFHAHGPEGTPPESPYWPRHFAQTDPEAHAKGFMLRTADWKLVTRVNGKDELYDLKADPKEKHNVFGQPGTEAVTAELKNRQLLWLAQTADVVPFDYDTRFSREMIWAKVRRLVPPEHEAEIREKIDAGAGLFEMIQECRKRFGKA